MRLCDGAHLTARHLGRIGRMLLQGGQWKGKTIVENLAPLTEPTQASPGYGAGVWLNVPLDSIPSSRFEEFWSQVPERILLTHDEKRLIYDGASSEMVMAAGRYNQRLYVLPSRRMVVVRLGRADRTWSDRAFLARLLDGKTSPGDPPNSGATAPGRGNSASTTATRTLNSRRRSKRRSTLPECWCRAAEPHLLSSIGTLEKGSGRAGVWENPIRDLFLREVGTGFFAPVLPFAHALHKMS